jgi:acetyl esterase/lipase
MLTEAERTERLEAAWEEGTLFSILGVFSDVLINAASNDVVACFIRDKIRSIVTDPDVAETLCPVDYPFGTKRPCLDTGYYETFNRDNVSLVDLRKTPITTITEAGIDTAAASFDFDVLVFATGFDAMTGALVGVDIQGRDGATLKDAWADGPVTYLGLTVVGFPNFFTVTGPGSPSVLSNMLVSIEQHVDWICETIAELRDDGFATIEPTDTAQAGWVQHVNDAADITLYPHANSWYMGANVPGKPRVFLPYVGGVDNYRVACNEVVEQRYLGFRRAGLGVESRSEVNDGVIRTMQLDVSMVLDFMAELGLPPLESLSPAEARAFMEASSEQRPPGPEVGEIVDGTLPGADGELRYRLYRPDTPGPHPLTVYFHGGGWVLGSEQSDDPLCRDLCVRSGAAILSVDYRHAPEHPFPAAPDDAWAAVQWAAENAETLGAIPGPMVLAGWSAGANLAAVTCQTARDAGGPAIAGQVLITPVTDSDFGRSSYTENADGYVLTKGLMEWFWGHYDVADPTDPRVAPLRAADLSGLPPALIMTADFDPLRDEGIAYVEALQAAGVDARHLRARGHIHTSIGSVDVIVSSAPLREEIAAAIQGFLPAAAPVG